MFALGVRSLKRMEGVHPDLVRVVALAISRSSYDFAVTEGVRDVERQKQLVAQGFSKTMKSKHLLQADGYGHAVDVMAVGDLDKDGDSDAQDKKHTWDKEIYREIAIAMYSAASDLGIKIRWGGDFKSFFDGPHFELL